MSRPERRFLLRLCVALGKTQRELLNEIDAEEFAEWMAFDRIDPLPELRADLRHATMSALLVEPHRDPKRKPQPFGPKDFLLDFDKPYRTKEPQSVDVQKALLKTLGTNNGDRR